MIKITVLKRLIVKNNITMCQKKTIHNHLRYLLIICSHYLLFIVCNPWQKIQTIQNHSVDQIRLLLEHLHINFSVLTVIPFCHVKRNSGFSLLKMFIEKVNVLFSQKFLHNPSGWTHPQSYYTSVPVAMVIRKT